MLETSQFKKSYLFGQTKTTVNLRTRGNYIRLRLMQGEVNTLEQTAQMKDSVDFFGGKKLVYELRISDRYDTVLENNPLSISIPEQDAFQWVQMGEVGLEKILDLSNRDELNLLIEKNFNYLVDRPNEDESDIFPSLSKEVC